MEPAWSREEFEQRLRDKGRAYHIYHPFNVIPIIILSRIAKILSLRNQRFGNIGIR